MLSRGLIVLIAASTACVQEFHSDVQGTSVQSQEPCPAVLEDGARCLFVGHSFFVPVALAFDELAIANEFSMHQMEVHFRGGAGGSPRSLWEDTSSFEAIESLLATGEVELFGMTSFAPENSRVEDYAQWINLALAYNPDTRFFIGTPWMSGGPSLPTDAFTTATDAMGENTFQIIDELRSEFPDQQIDYLLYGKTATVMKRMFDVGQLPNVTQLSGPSANALFMDPVMGHGGPMMLEVSALSWLDVLYGADLDDLIISPYESDVHAIIAEVLAHNEPYQQACTDRSVDPTDVSNNNELSDSKDSDTLP